MLRNTLSINVALFVVILVGLDIVGSRFLFRLISRNSFVCGCWCVFRRSRLWSIPSIISWVLILVRCFIRFLYSSKNFLTLVFGGPVT